jgi:hypothetical protein
MQNQSSDRNTKSSGVQQEAENNPCSSIQHANESSNRSSDLEDASKKKSSSQIVTLSQAEPNDDQSEEGEVDESKSNIQYSFDRRLIFS